MSDRRRPVRSIHAPSSGPVIRLGSVTAATVAPASAGLSVRSSTSSTTPDGEHLVRHPRQRRGGDEQRVPGLPPQPSDALPVHSGHRRSLVLAPSGARRREPATDRLPAMRAVTFQAPGDVRLEDRPEPEMDAGDDAVVRVEATGVCGSDLHIYHGRVQIEPGFTIGHEFVGEVMAAGRRRFTRGRWRPRARLLLQRLR